MTKLRSRRLLCLTPIFILLAHYLAVFPHEYAHSFMAWLLGFKSDPLNLTYGGTGWLNLFFLWGIDENVDYLTIFNAGHGGYVALIAAAGSVLANGTLYILSLYLLRRSSVKNNPVIFYFLFWFNLMNLGNFYDYVPIRTFASHGDVYNFVTGLNISPWLVYVVGGYVVAFLIWHFFSQTLITTYECLKLQSAASRAVVLISSTIILFGYFGGIIGVLTSSANFSEISPFLSVTSFLMIPMVVLACWPTRKCKINKSVTPFDDAA